MGRPVENCDRFARKTSVEFITCDFHNPLSSKSQTLDGLLDHKKNSVRVLKEIVKRLDKSLKRLDKPLER